jgi:hypothetical protein
MRTVRSHAALVAATLAISMSGLSTATAQSPVACWDYTTIADKIGGRFGIKGTADDTILSRSAYYDVRGLSVKVSAPLAGVYNSAIKLELRSDAEGAETPLKLSGMFVEVSDVNFPDNTKGIKFETHASDDRSYLSFRVLPLEVRFKAGDAVVSAPLSATRESNGRTAKVVLRLGAYSPASWVQGKKPVFDPAETLPQVLAIQNAWKSAGAMTIEFVEPQSGAIVAVSSTIDYFGDKAEAEANRANSRARDMLKGGKCQYLD